MSTHSNMAPTAILRKRLIAGDAAKAAAARRGLPTVSAPALAAAPAPKPTAASPHDLFSELFRELQKHAAFAEPPRPLALRIDKEIHAALGKRYGRRIIGKVLAWHTGRKVYVAAVAAGGPRFNLAGEPVGEVTEAQRDNAAARLAQRREAQ